MTARDGQADLWDARAAPGSDDPLDQCVYGSRLLGADPTLVLHGGGNTSVKTRVADVTGEPVDVLHVKGSGWDLATIERAGFTGLRLDRLRALLRLDRLPDAAMMNELRAARLDAGAPDPSVESLLHALLPHASVLHTHADAVIALTNQLDPDTLLREVYGDDVIVVPYVMPGFDLAHLCADIVPRQLGPHTLGIVLRNHGLFTFGDTTEVAYRRHVALAARAEAFVAARPPAWSAQPVSAKASTQPASTQPASTQPASTQPASTQPAAAQPAPTQPAPTQPASTQPAPIRPVLDPVAQARIRHDLSRAAGAPMIVSRHDDEAVRAFVTRPDLAGRGPLTPDHVIRTKRVPLIGTDVAAYARAYTSYFETHRARRGAPLAMLDPAPRVVLDPAFGMLTAGRRAADADIAADIYRHTIDTIERAERVGSYRALPAADLFDVEYWELEQAKLRRAGGQPPFAGEVALVTGAASGIGRACAAALRSAGAAVIGMDLNPCAVDAPDFLGVQVDVTDAGAVTDALAAGVDRFGGVDIVVAAAGVFAASQPIATLDPHVWRRTMAVNVDSVAALLTQAHPLLALAPRGGRVVVIASKNVPAPGPGAAAYSASKAALTQLARVAALEWAADGIRVNAVHPDAVFDTGLWTPELLAERAAGYRLTVAEYKRRNLLGVEVTSALVGDLVVALCGNAFAATTGAQVPVDGGNDRVI